jgi:ribonuclease D
LPGNEREPSTLYLDATDAVDNFVASIQSAPAIAVDTEGASFHRYVDRIYLLQLSTPHHHAIIDPLRVAPLAGLGALLESPRVEVVFHDADYDLRLLHQDYGWRVRNIFDTRIAAQLLGIKTFGLAALLESNFGVKLDKKHQRADWSMRPLTRDMLDYAAQDTRHLLALRDRMYEALDRKDRWSWAREEFARLEGTRWEPEDPALGFMRLKGARDLNRRELALLRELALWREGVARSLDRSTFRVAGNDVLFDLSRRAPRTMDELKTIKGLSRGVVERQGGEILDAIGRGLAVPEYELPRFPKAARWDRDPEFEDRVGRLKTVRDRVAAELEVDPGVLCPRERLENIARRKPKSLEELAEVPDVRKWQIELLGADFLKALKAGRQAPEETAAPSPPDVAQAPSVSHSPASSTSSAVTVSAAEESPYRDA